MSLDEPMTRNLCPACGCRVEDYAPGVSYVTVDGQRFHPRCAPIPESPPRSSSERAREPIAVPLEQQLRKSLELGRIKDGNLVEWGDWVDEGTPNERYEFSVVCWGDLSTYERQTVERQPNGKLVGGSPR